LKATGRIYIDAYHSIGIIAMNQNTHHGPLGVKIAEHVSNKLFIDGIVPHVAGQQITLVCLAISIFASGLVIMMFFNRHFVWVIHAYSVKAELHPVVWGVTLLGTELIAAYFILGKIPIRQ
jgi:hypothetical protein